MKLTPLGKFLQRQDTRRARPRKQQIVHSRVFADLFVTGCSRIDGLTALTVQREQGKNTLR